MKFTLNLFAVALLSFNLSPVTAIVIPEPNAVARVDSVERGLEVLNGTRLSGRAGDDQWELITYDGNPSGGQCGGVETYADNGTGDKSCVDTKKTNTCVNLSVGANFGFLTCKFDFSRTVCGGSDQTYTVKRGDTSKGLSLPSVKFETVTCSD